MEVKYGGPNPMKLVAHDNLQYSDSSYVSWKDVKIVEGKKPPHPDSLSNALAEENLSKMIYLIKTLNDKNNTNED